MPTFPDHALVARFLPGEQASPCICGLPPLPDEVAVELVPPVPVLVPVPPLLPHPASTRPATASRATGRARLWRWGRHKEDIGA